MEHPVSTILRKRFTYGDICRGCSAQLEAISQRVAWRQLQRTDGAELVVIWSRLDW